MSARALFLSLLVGAAGGALAAWAIGAWTDRAVTADATTVSTVQPVSREESDPEPEAGPMLVGSPPVTPTDQAWREAMEQRFARIEARLEKIEEQPAPSEEETETIDPGALDDDALTARYHRAWLKHAHNDLEGARTFMRQVATSESSPSFWRLFSRANAADFSIRLGDTANAQADLEEFKRELEGDDSPTGQRVRVYVNQLLESLEK